MEHIKEELKKIPSYPTKKAYCENCGKTATIRSYYQATTGRPICCGQRMTIDVLDTPQ